MGGVCTPIIELIMAATAHGRKRQKLDYCVVECYSIIIIMSCKNIPGKNHVSHYYYYYYYYYYD